MHFTSEQFFEHYITIIVILFMAEILQNQLSQKNIVMLLRSFLVAYGTIITDLSSCDKSSRTTTKEQARSIWSLYGYRPSSLRQIVTLAILPMFA